MRIKCLSIFQPLIAKPKRLKIIVGGRASTKTTFVADRVACGLTQGELWACGREFQNSIDDSVHRTLQEEIERLDLSGFEVQNNQIMHDNGGRAFYLGLARNINSLKGKLSGVTGLWIEEGEGLSDETLQRGLPSVRATALEFERAKREGRPIREPEIWITMNRGSREDPVSKLYLSRAEPDLAACGYYEDDEMIVVQANYTDIPRSWFLGSGLEKQRASDEARLPPKVYNWKWHGHYIEEIENALIHEEWFNACIDAHEKLGFAPAGVEVVAHDPSDLGPDPKGLCYRHGSVIMDVLEKPDGDIFEGTDWAVNYALDKRADLFVWDGDGAGAPLRERIAAAFKGKKIAWEMYKGSEGVENPEETYQEIEEQEEARERTNKDVFYNMRAQQYCALRDRMYRTWEAVTLGKYHNPDDLISFSSKIELINKLRAELCRLPLKPNGNGKIQLMSKQEMKSRYGISSPNLSDSVKMSLRSPNITQEYKPIGYTKWQ